MLEAADTKAAEVAPSEAGQAAAQQQPAAAAELSPDFQAMGADIVASMEKAAAKKPFTPANPAAAKKPFTPANPAAAVLREGAHGEEEEPETKAHKGQGEGDRPRRHFLDKLKARGEDERAKALQYGKKKGVLLAAPVEVLLWGVEQGHLTQEDLPAMLRGAARVAPVEAAPAAAPMPAAQPAAGGAADATAVPTAQGAQPPPPPPQLAMGVPVEEMKRAAIPAAALVRHLCTLAKRPGLDPTQPLKMKLGRGQPWEFDIDGVPEEMLTELVAAELAQSVMPKLDGGSQWMRRVQLMALGGVVFAPLVKARVREGAQLVKYGWGVLMERRRARRAAR